MNTSRFLSLSVVALFVIIVAGCWKSDKSLIEDATLSGKNEFSTTQEAQTIADKRVTGNDLCDQYLEQWQCAIDSNTSTTKNFSQEKYDSLLASFKDVPSDQLQALCTTLVDSMKESLQDNQVAKSCGLFDIVTGTWNIWNSSWNTQ